MDTKAVFTPEVIEAALALLGMIVVGFFPELKPGIDSIRAGIAFILLTLIGSQTVHRVSARQEETKIQVARLQAAAAENKYPPQRG